MRSWIQWIKSAPAGFMLFLISIYWRTLSPVIGQACRFQPSCSRYTAACIERFGAIRGAYLGFFRILRCQPLCKGGYDPIPTHFHWRPSCHAAQRADQKSTPSCEG